MLNSDKQNFAEDIRREDRVMKHRGRREARKQKKLQRQLTGFKRYLKEEERSPATMEKYIAVIRGFLQFTEERNGEKRGSRLRGIDKESIIAYKQRLVDEGKSPQTVNSHLSAIRSYLKYTGREDIEIKNMKSQHRSYVSESRMLTRREYERLLQTARREGRRKLGLIIETLCATGMRVSELPYVTVEAIEEGEIRIRLKGKIREILISEKLRKKLRSYAAEEGIEKGEIFINSRGRPIHRSQIWQMMKELAKGAGVDAEKVFPHNLRRLFARSFYRLRRDIAALADILGHSRIDTTRIYIAVTAEDHIRMLEELRLVT